LYYFYSQEYLLVARLAGMKLILCLGNPGAEYEHHRHNIGFRFADCLVSHFSLQPAGQKFKSTVYEGLINGEKCLVLKPKTFMNCSGEALVAAVSFYKLLATDCLVVYDDFDIPFTELRFRQSGSAGTHNGMKSVVQLMGTLDIPRLRVGIGPLPQGASIVNFVLSNFSKEEEAKLPDILPEGVKLMMQRFFNV